MTTFRDALKLHHLAVMKLRIRRLPTQPAPQRVSATPTGILMVVGDGSVDEAIAKAADKDKPTLQ